MTPKLKMVFVLVVIVLLVAAVLMRTKLGALPRNQNPVTKKIMEINQTQLQHFPEQDQDSFFRAEVGSDWVKINDQWSFRFDSVVSDNRCPKGVTCATAGEAVVKVQFMQPGVDYYKAYFENLVLPGGVTRSPMPNGPLVDSLLKPLKIERKDAITGKDISFTITLADLQPLSEGKFYDDVSKINYTGLFKIEPIK